MSAKPTLTGMKTGIEGCPFFVRNRDGAHYKARYDPYYSKQEIEMLEAIQKKLREG